MVALHARKSAASIAAFPGPVVVALTGTDLYLDLPASPEVHASLAKATVLVGLHRLVARALPDVHRPKVRVILQSVLPGPEVTKDEPWSVAVVGHMRAVKDPLLAAQATRLLPADSRIRVTQIGAALDDGVGEAARALEGPRYWWIGEVPREDALRRLAASHLLIVSSRHEGGANVVGEAVVSGVPVVASRIDGNLGLLGEDWPATFEVGDARGLAETLVRWERDPGLRAEIGARTRALQPDFAPEREREAWRTLLAPLHPA